MTILYVIWDTGEGEPMAYARLSDAKQEAQATADYYERECGVCKITLAKLPRRELAIALLTRTGFAEDDDVVFTATPNIYEAD